MFLRLIALACLASHGLATPTFNLLQFVGGDKPPRFLRDSKAFADHELAVVEQNRQKHPDAYLTAIELIEKHGYRGEAYQAITQDNYILEIHRIAGKKGTPVGRKRPVVFLMHGLLANSATWILPGPEKSLPYILSDAGYDVWMGNARGSTYSRKHMTWTVKDKEYWAFSWHEIGMYDLPAMIDRTLKVTGQKNLFYIGHSQGTTSFFVMASQRHEYQKKIKAMFALAPVAYCSRLTSPPLQFMALFTNKIEALTKFIGMYEFKPTNDFMRKFTSVICDEEAITQPICTNTLFMLGGYNREQMNMTLLPTILGHVPSGASVNQVMHYGQLVRSAKFRQFDHGMIANWRIYKKVKPPAYDLGSIKVPVHLHYSTNDWLAHVRDVHQLYQELGNPVLKLRVPDKKFNHLDYIWGIDAKTLLYEKILSLMYRIKSDDKE